MVALTAERPRETAQRSCTRCDGLVAADSAGDDRCLSCGRSPGWLERSQAQAPKVPKSDYGPGVHPEEAQRDFAWYRARLDVEEAEDLYLDLDGLAEEETRTPSVKCLTCPESIPGADPAVICPDYSQVKEAQRARAPKGQQVIF